MNIIETEYPDVNVENLESTKINIANRILQEVGPLFDEVYDEKHNKVYKLKNEIKLKQDQIKYKRNLLADKLEKIETKKKIHSLLQRMEKVVFSKLIYNGNIKHELTILLKIVDTLNPDQIKEHTSRMIQLINTSYDTDSF